MENLWEQQRAIISVAIKVKSIAGLPSYPDLYRSFLRAKQKESDQMNKRKSRSKVYEYNGQMLSALDLSRLEECEVKRNTVYKRLKNGIPAHKAIKKKLSRKSCDHKIVEKADLQKESTEIKPTPSKKMKLEAQSRSSQKEKIKAIFLIPVNPRKCRYHKS